MEFGRAQIDIVISRDAEGMPTALGISMAHLIG